MNYEAVIFDCDGVLVDSESISNRYLVELAREEGIDIDLQYSLQNFQGHALAHVFQEMEKLKGSALKANFEEDFRQRTFRAFAEEIEAVDGARDLIESLDCPMAVASNTIVIEDSMAGVEAALKGGFKVYALVREHTRNQLAQSDALLIEHLSEIT